MKTIELGCGHQGIYEDGAELEDEVWCLECCEYVAVGREVKE